MSNPRSFEAVLGVEYKRERLRGDGGRGPYDQAGLRDDDGGLYLIPHAALDALKDPVRGDPARVRLRLTVEEEPRS